MSILDEVKNHLEKTFLFGGVYTIGIFILDISEKYSLSSTTTSVGMSCTAAGVLLLFLHWGTTVFDAVHNGPFSKFLYTPVMLSLEVMVMWALWAIISLDLT